MCGGYVGERMDAWGLGGGDSPQDVAERMRQEELAREQERQRRIQEAIDRINQLFADPARQQEYEAVRRAAAQRLQQQLDRQREAAQRSVRFALARQGLLGGSADVDAGSLIGRDYERALLEAQARASETASGLESADQATKQRLISLAQSGLDADTAIQQALAQHQADVAAAQADAQTAQLGDVFSSLGNAYRTWEEIQGMRQARVPGVAAGRPVAPSPSQARRRRDDAGRLTTVG